jgi:hypothetical protein
MFLQQGYRIKSDQLFTPINTVNTKCNEIFEYFVFKIIFVNMIIA